MASLTPASCGNGRKVLAPNADGSRARERVFAGHISSGGRLLADQRLESAEGDSSFCVMCLPVTFDTNLLFGAALQRGAS